MSWLTKLGREVGQGLLHLIYPGLCHLCGRSLAPGAGPFCSPCREALLHDPQASCPRCAETVGPFTNTAEGCSNCRKDSFAFESVIRLGPYAAVWREAVLRLKHSTGEVLAELLGALWADHARTRFQSMSLDAIVPMPLHWWRRCRRGYNQSAALAHGLSAMLGVPCRPNWLRRVRNTPAQHLLPASARRENLKGAFRAATLTRVRDKTVLLVDDVMTTGATAHEAASALRKAGVSRVVVAAFSKASL